MQLLRAVVTSLHTVRLEWDNSLPVVGVHLPNYTITKIIPLDENNLSHQVEIHEELKLHQPIEILWNQQTLIAELSEITQTTEFEERYRYDGPLGVERADELTTFRLFAPTAKQVELQLYPNEDPSIPVAQIYAMTRNVDGVWAISLTGETEGLVYDYHLVFPDGHTCNSYDPYARACVINGRRSVVYFGDDILANDSIPTQKYHNHSEILMMHAHVKTLTNSVTTNIHQRLRGKYLGVIEPGTKTTDGYPTGLDYIKQYQPTHLRLMAIADFGSVNEKRQDQYSVGDDPININVPEGSYASDPFKPIVRIEEAKKMIKGLHQHQLKIILDMMYSQIYNPSQHALELCVPGYFLRTDNNGRLTKEFASEKYMGRRYILDSVRYWFENYHIDGICFKAINAIDLETMKAIREIADEINPDHIIMGELSPTKVVLASEDQATLQNANQLLGVNFINPSLQMWLENYPNLDYEDSQRLMANMLGEFYEDQHINIIGPDQIIQSLSMLSKPTAVHSEEKWYKFILSIYFLSQGAISLDIDETIIDNQVTSLVDIDWNKVDQYQQIKDYLQQLISFRYKHPVFALDHYADIQQKQHQIHVEEGIIAYSLQDQNVTYIIAINTTDQKRTLSLPTGQYEILIDQGEINEFPRSLEIYDDIAIYPMNVLLICRK